MPCRIEHREVREDDRMKRQKDGRGRHAFSGSSGKTLPALLITGFITTGSSLLLLVPPKQPQPPIWHLFECKNVNLERRCPLVKRQASNVVEIAPRPWQGRLFSRLSSGAMPSPSSSTRLRIDLDLCLCRVRWKGNSPGSNPTHCLNPTKSSACR